MPERDNNNLIDQLERLDPLNHDAQWQAAIKLGELSDSRAIEALINAINYIFAKS